MTSTRTIETRRPDPGRTSAPDLLGLYLDEAGSFPLLTKADEMRLGQIIQEGQTARATLAVNCTGLHGPLRAMSLGTAPRIAKRDRLLEVVP